MLTIHDSWICLVTQKCGQKCNWFDRRVKNLKCGWYPPDACELALLEIWSRYHYNKKRRRFKTILIWRSSRKMNRNKNLLIYYLWKMLSKFCNAQKKSFPWFFFSTCSTASSKFSFYVSLCEINCVTIQTISFISKSILVEILCVLFTLTSSFASDWCKLI